MRSLSLKGPHLFLRNLWGVSIDVIGAWEMSQNGEITLDGFGEAIRKLDAATTVCERRGSRVLKSPNLLLRDLWSASVGVLEAWELWRNGEVPLDGFGEAVQKLNVAATSCERAAATATTSENDHEVLR